MLRLLWIGSLLVSAGVLGCGDTSEGGTQEPIFIEPGPTCTAFCAQAVGECEVTVLGDDGLCKQSCEQERSLADQTSEACLEAFEASVDCAAALDCQYLIDRANQVNLDTYPCLSELESSDIICTQ